MAVSTIPNIIRVVEKGTNNSWGYRKYSDGTYEAWRKYSGTVNLTNSSAGTYYGPDINITLPSFNKGLDVAQATAVPSLSSGIFVYSVEPSTVTTLKINFRAHASTSNATASANLFIRGTY